MSKEVKNANKAKQRFIDFKNGQMEWSITTLINKGEELKATGFLSNRNDDDFDSIDATVKEILNKY